MIKITQEKWDSIHKDFKGIYQNYNGNNPELKGRKTTFSGSLLNKVGTELMIEGIDFIIE